MPDSRLRLVVKGALIGRYVVLSRLGAGAMGMVLVAYDPELDRKVALKLLKPRGGNQDQARQRLQREAQALARLNHPNVVSVHDVGVHEGQVFVAMELVEGQTLCDWMRSSPEGRPRPWPEVVERLRAAGRGLAAAHAVGLVHRDFKPDNVMIGTDGRVRVMDFGLARARLVGAPSERACSPVKLDLLMGSEVEARLTRTGAMVGTPAYMAPEQFQGVGVTASADQFAFCAVLYEALYAARPFTGQTVMELARAVTQDHVSEPPANVTVPLWLKRLVMRGLSRAPHKRFESMAELLVQLDQGEAKRRRTRRLFATATVLVGIAGVMGVRQYSRTRGIERCEVLGDSIDEVWNPATRETLRDGFMARTRQGAAEMVDKVMPWIDRNARSWRTSATMACMQGTVERTWDEAKLDKARWCLEVRRNRLSALVTDLPQSGGGGALSAIETAANLELADACVDDAHLAIMIEPPPVELRPRLSRVQEVLTQVQHQQSTGHYDHGLELLGSVRSDAEAWPPLRSELLLNEAVLLDSSGQRAQAEAAAVRAFMAASKSQAWNIAAKSASWLAFVIGRHLDRDDEAQVWAEHARVCISHAGDPQRLLEAHLLGNLGLMHYLAGRYARAKVVLEQVLRLDQEIMGSSHPKVADHLNNLGVVHLELGEFHEALELHQRALSIRRAVLGPEHVKVARSMTNLANAYWNLGEYERAKALFGSALRINEKALGPDHFDNSMLLRNLGVAHKETHHYEEARAFIERSLKIAEKVLGSEHSEIAIYLINLGDVLEAQGDLWGAWAVYERALHILESAKGPDDPQIVYALIGMGTVLVTLGHGAQGLQDLERAVAMSAADDVAPLELAWAQFALARGLWEVSIMEGGDRDRALELALAAFETFVEDESTPKVELEKAESWLRTRAE